MNALFATLAIAAVLTVPLVLAAPSAASERAPGCPDDVAIGNLTLAEPGVLVGIGDSNARLADRDRDGLVCSTTLRLFGRPVVQILTDNALGDPTFFPPDPCTDPFETVSIGDPNLFPWIRQIDLTATAAFALASSSRPSLTGRWWCSTTRI